MSKYYCPCCFGHHAEGIEHCKAFSHIPSLEGIEHVEKCPNTPHNFIYIYTCPACHGTGVITRPAEWGDIDIKKIILYLTDKPITSSPLTTKSGGRLRVTE